MKKSKENPPRFAQGNNIDLLHGKILTSLTGLALPIMATSLLQTAYNLTDMVWIGLLGSHAVTAVGTAGMYIWLSGGVVTLARMGGQIKVAHSLGKGQQQEAAEFAKGAIQLTIVLALIFALVTNVFTDPLIGIFGLKNSNTVYHSVIYLRITGGLILWSFLNQTLTGIFTAIGDSKTPFLANILGLVGNVVFDPVLIFGWGPFPEMGTAGAAVATVFAQMMVTLVMINRARRDTVLFHRIRIGEKTKPYYLKAILQLGFPSAIQNMLYTSISMVLTRMVATWGDTAVAVQRVGGQIESLSWMTAEGFGAAMNAFTGQNYGARLYDRIRKSYYMAAVMMGIWGLMTTGLMIFGAEWLFRLFIREAEAVPIGISYLIVLGYGQMFMCEELLTVGALQGLGKTLSCSLIMITLTAARIPLAMILGQTSLGLDGIWWALTISSMVKGISFFGYYLWTLRQLPGGRSREGITG